MSRTVIEIPKIYSIADWERAVRDNAFNHYGLQVLVASLLLAEEPDCNLEAFSELSDDQRAAVRVMARQLEPVLQQVPSSYRKGTIIAKTCRTK